jgi:hypothetical protein
MARLKIDQFYLHPKRGVMKFVGYNADGLLMLDRYDKWVEGGWQPQNRLHVADVKHAMRPIPPPE